jgi:tRNA pseudouridine38-40 synthase
VSPRENQRFELTLHYVGTAFHGWQVQPGMRTVQGELEAVVERITERHRTVLGSGRTDAGVHATGQVASVDVPVRWTGARLRAAMNALLPRDVWVEAARPVPAGFHPRYDARARTYRYRIGLAPEAFSPFHRPFCWALEERVEREALEAGAALLPGEHSFLAFAKAGQPNRGDRCTVLEARWSEWEPLGLAFTVTANRYLHHMVRYLVGTMVDVARERRPLDELAALLKAPGGELVTSPPAPSQGLYLARVQYPPEAYDPSRARAPITASHSRRTPPT